LIEEAREIVNVFAGFSAPAGFCKVKSMKALTVDRRVKDSLTDAEIKQFLDSAAPFLPQPLETSGSLSHT